MKVELNLNLRAYSGKLGNVVYISHFNYRLCHGRFFTCPKLTEENLRIKDINANLNDLYLQATEDYRKDLTRYSQLNRMENQARSVANRKQMPGAKALFVQCMWAWAKANPEPVDLKTMTLSDQITIEAPVCKVSTCVEAGYFLIVTNWDSLDHYFQ